VEVDTDKNLVKLNVKLSKAYTPKDVAFSTSDSDRTLVLYAPSGNTAKVSYAFIFSGITKGDITEQGLAKLVIEKSKAVKFKDYDPSTSSDPAGQVIKVVKNGRTYYVEKVVEVTIDDNTDPVKHPFLSTTLVGNPFYKLYKVGYRVYLLGNKKLNTDGTKYEYELIPVAQLDTESVTWSSDIADVTLRGEEVEGLGCSLGLEKITSAAPVLEVDKDKALPTEYDFTSGYAPSTALVFRTVLSDGTVRYVDGGGKLAFDADELARLNTMLADFGFSTDVDYTYKLEDKYFTTAGQETRVLTATYNNGTVVPVETEEETDVEEGTEEEELEEDEDIVEDIDEELEEDDEVPATGDFAADIALALTAAAIVAAAALAFVMKKARD